MFKYFKLEEFACQETGENEISEEFVHALDALRHEAGFPFVITSGYRSPSHSLEAKKPNGGGQHTTGRAADIAVSGGVQRYLLVAAAIKLGFSGIGVAKGFVHVDTRTSARVIWVY
jgi:zinc D-Ala-D-Ala carboxypeptidase